VKRLRAVLFFANPPALAHAPALALALTLALAPALRAADYTWTGSALNSTYNTPGNWLGGAAPPTNDPTTTIYFTDQGAGAVHINASTATFGQFVFQNTTAPYTISGNNANFTLSIAGAITLSTGAVTLDSIKLNGNTLQANGPGRLTLNNVASTTPQATFAITGNAPVQITGSATLGANLAVQSAQVIINSGSALPSSGKITATGGYVGYTQNFAASFSAFLARIQAINDPNTIVGIDSATPATNRVVPDTIDLTKLNGADRDSPYYIGTTSNITLTGPVKPTLLPGGAGYDTLYLAALGNGYLNIATPLGNAASPVNSITIGQPAALQPNQGAVELSGNNTYAGATRVLGGTLQVNGAGNLGSGALAIASGATLNTGAAAVIDAPVTLALAPGSTLAGAGTFNIPVTIGHAVNLVPGALGSAATLHLHSGLTLDAGANIYLDLGANATDILGTRGFITINGNIADPITIYLNSITNANATGAYAGFDPNAAYTWKIFYDTGNNPLLITGFNPAYFQIDATAFAQLNNTNGGAFDIALLNNNALGITFTPVPEPGTYALTLLGLVMLAFAELRRRRK